MMQLGDRRWDHMALLAIGAGALARGLWIFWLHPPPNYLYSDMQVYVHYAAALARGDNLNVYATLQPQGTHLLLALPLAIFGDGRLGLWAAAALWWALSAATPFFAWRLTRTLLTPAAAALTALFAAIWPLHVTNAGYFLSETPSLAFLVAALWLAYGVERRHGGSAVWRGVLAGGLGAIAVACRPQFLLNLAVVVFPFLPRRLRDRRATLAFAATIVVMLAGVVALNSAIAGRLTGLSREGGVTFYVGQCHVRQVSMSTPTTSYSIGPPPYVQNGGADVFVPNREVWEEGFFYRRGLDCVRRKGARYPLHAARMIADMTATSKPWPQVNEATLSSVVAATNTFYGYGLLPLVVVVALVRIVRRVPTWRGEAVLLAHLLCVVPIVIVFFGDPRFRAPYDLFGLALAAAALASQLRRAPR